VLCRNVDGCVWSRGWIAVEMTNNLGPDFVWAEKGVSGMVLGYYVVLGLSFWLFKCY
jgi:hypothetical protein